MTLLRTMTGVIALAASQAALAHPGPAHHGHALEIIGLALLAGVALFAARRFAPQVKTAVANLKVKTQGVEARGEV